MKTKLIGLAQRYVTALQKHLKLGPGANLQAAVALGRQAVALGLETLELARIHERAVGTLELSGSGTRLLKRAEIFFAEAVTPIMETHRAARPRHIQQLQLKEKLNGRTQELAATNRRLQRDVVRHKSVEAALKKSGDQCTRLLNEALLLQGNLRRLTHQMLAAQEDDRTNISRELQNEIAQTLLGINVRLLSLEQNAKGNSQDFKNDIASTQLLVLRSAESVHRFARELRPAVLDDLGIIPALHTFLKTFREETGIQVSLSAFADVEQVNGDKRTVLYRVTQEALTNVARHAQASEAEVRIEKLDGAVCLKIKDNGKGFLAERVLHARKQKRLGLLGMRERVGMVHGTFTIESAPGRGTTVQAQIPLTDTRAGESKATAPNP